MPPTILITGVGRGLGRQLALNFLKRCGTTIPTSNTTANPLHIKANVTRKCRGCSVMGTVRDVQQSPPDVECFACDVTSAESLVALQEQLRDRR